MNVTKETVTPKKAMDYLKRNVANRPMKLKRASRYAELMRLGKWKLNGETVKFNGNGDLIDGQHRLAGCVEAGKPFETYVVRGLPHEAFDTIDGGIPRSGGDILARHGEKHYNMLAAAAGMIYKLENVGAVEDGCTIRTDQITECLERHPGLRASCDFACSARQDAILSTSIVAALYYAMGTVKLEASHDFWKKVLIGENLTANMPEYRLRKRLIENKASQAKLRRVAMCALCIKAWTLSTNGRTTKALGYFDREEFPRIEGFKYRA